MVRMPEEEKLVCGPWTGDSITSISASLQHTTPNTWTLYGLIYGDIIRLNYTGQSYRSIIRLNYTIRVNCKR
jgi:hypothetical protein